MEMNELRPLACANLTGLLGDPDIKLEQGLHRIRAGGDYDACVLLLDQFWSDANIPVDGELVTAVPARDFLVVTGSNDTAAVARLKRLAQEVASQASYRLTSQLFVRRANRWVPYG